MVDRVVELFADVPSGVVVDATLGAGGHSEAILDSRGDLGVLGIDRDADAIDAATRRLERFGDRVTYWHGRFDEIRIAVRSSGREPIVGALFDLGVSSPQLDRAERGFSYRQKGPLDMRMDNRQKRRADDVVNATPVAELISILQHYGEERHAARVARAIVANRPIADTEELAEVVRTAIPAATRRRGGHPAKRTFQAIRVSVNEELDVLADSLDSAIDLLLPGGRLVAMSYHSGEDRIVKDRFRNAATGGCECPVELGCVCGAVPKVDLIRRGAEKAPAGEIADNRRAESVRLRAVERVRVLPPTGSEVAS